MMSGFSPNFFQSIDMRATPEEMAVFREQTRAYYAARAAAAADQPVPHLSDIVFIDGQSRHYQAADGEISLDEAVRVVVEESIANGSLEPGTGIPGLIEAVRQRQHERELNEQGGVS